LKKTIVGKWQVGKRPGGKMDWWENVQVERWISEKTSRWENSLVRKHHSGKTGWWENIPLRKWISEKSS
jgi:hypothetical protein